MILEKLRKADIVEIKLGIPYQELDKNIVNLVKVINSFEDIYTIGSCGGHKKPKSYQLPDGEWNVIFKVHNSKSGWISLEFLVWLFNNSFRRQGYNVMVSAYAPPPYLNGELGSCLYFILEGWDISPDKLIEEITMAKKELYKQSIL